MIIYVKGKLKNYLTTTKGKCTAVQCLYSNTFLELILFKTWNKWDNAIVAQSFCNGDKSGEIRIVDDSFVA